MNITLREEGFNKRRVYKKKFEELGLPLVSEVTLHNIDHLEKTILWNEEYGIRLFRFTQIFPWIDQYPFSSLPGWRRIRDRLKEVGGLATFLNHRLTVHPSEFCVMASPRSEAVENSIRELNQVSRVFNLLGFEPSPFNKVNIHVGGTYGDKEATAKRFCSNFRRRLNPHLKLRLTVENEDRPNGFSLKDLYDLIYNEIGIPLVFDVLHHQLNPGGLSEEDAMKLAASTWPEGIRPIIHYSESRKEFEDPEAMPTAHTDFLHREINSHGIETDIMIEAKKTELALLKYLEDH